jgi:hypothetical protein
MGVYTMLRRVCGADRDGTSPPFRPRHVRGRAFPDHARADGGRTCQVRHSVVCADATGEGEPCPMSHVLYHSFATKRLVVVHIFYLFITVITILISCTAGQIERFARWIVHNPDIQERLSQAELAHAQRFVVWYILLL